MNILLPKFNLPACVLLIAFYCWCLLEGSEPSSEILFSIDPVTGIILGVGALAGGGGAFFGAKEAGDAATEAAKIQAREAKKAEKLRVKRIRSIYGPEAGRAAKRLSRKYGYSMSEIDEIVEGTMNQLEGQADAERAEIDRASGQLPLSGQMTKRRQGIFDTLMSQAAQTRLGATRTGEQAGLSRRSQDLSTVGNFAGMLGGIAPAQAQAPAFTPSPGVALASSLGSSMSNFAEYTHAQRNDPKKTTTIDDETLAFG